MIEIWKEVPGYEGYYEVSNMGNVRSMTRTVTKSNGVQQTRVSRMLPKKETADGYWDVRLCRDAIRKGYRVHRLVAMAFLPPPDGNIDDYEVHHKDANRKNNCLDNLEWVTHVENVRHSVECGTHVTCKDMSGENNPNYGNRKLSAFYENNPDISKEKQSRPGSQNGRAVPVRVFSFTGKFIGEFGCYKDCAEFLIKNDYIPQKCVQNVCNTISKCCKNGSTFEALKFEHI